MTTGTVIEVLFVGAFVMAAALLVRRKLREAPFRDAVRRQPVMYTTAALVRIQAKGLEGAGWGALKSPKGARLIIHEQGIEATIGRGDLLVSGNVMRASDATMWQGSIGWASTTLSHRECIRLQGFDGVGIRDWAVAPVDGSLDELWQALLEVGVTPTIRLN